MDSFHFAELHDIVPFNFYCLKFHARKNNNYELTVTGAVCATSGVGGRCRGLGLSPWFSVPWRLHGNWLLEYKYSNKYSA